jgi:16S rRNA (cytosine1402-N4)-methyltransferase
MSIHTPVLLDEVIRYLDPQPGRWIIDCTLNGGGHTAAFVEKGARVLGIEWDPTIARTFFDQRPQLRDAVIVVNDSYVNIERIAKEHSVEPEGILFDLGLSSVHYETSGRGFSFNRPLEPLDMRFNPETTAKTAGDLLNTVDPEELETILETYGEEQFAGQIAAAVAIARRTAPLRTVEDLVTVIESAVPAWYRHRKIHHATKTFQALRVVVNGELDNVERGVRAAIEVLKPQGVLAVISFQGSEDKLVREIFKDEVRQGKIEWVTRSTIRPIWKEIKANPRSRSAKMKIVKKI